ncbi:hypothetical protein QQ045_011497 [Rhodiola kirilowii]
MPESQVIMFIQAWLIVYACLAYTFAIGKIVPPGKVRSLFISPVVALLLLLPLRVTSVFLCASIASVSWLGTFKLALYSFGKGPLATVYPRITFIRFLALGSLPIILSTKSKDVEKIAAEIDHNPSTKSPRPVFAMKALLFAMLSYKLLMSHAQFHPTALFYIYGIVICLSLQYIVSGFRAMTEAVLGLELDPQFNDPVCATSVQNFWGRRWNQAMGNILRAGVYDPVRAVLSPGLGDKHAQRLAVLATFVTSAAMHELVFYYLSRKRPTWEMSWYFLLHGLTVVVEMDVKRRIGQRWRLPTVVSIILTFSFMSLTSIWLFLPQIYHCNCHVRGAEEFAAFVTFLQSLRSTDGSIIFSSFLDRVTLSHFLQQLVSY